MKRALLFSFLFSFLFFWGLAEARSVSACMVPTFDGVCCTDFETIYNFPSSSGCCIGGMPYAQDSGLCGAQGTCFSQVCVADPRPGQANQVLSVFLHLDSYYAGPQTPSTFEVFCGPNAIDAFSTTVTTPVEYPANSGHWTASAVCEYYSNYFHYGGKAFGNYTTINGTGTDNNEIFFRLNYAHMCIGFNSVYNASAPYDEQEFLNYFDSCQPLTVCPSTQNLDAYLPVVPRSCCAVTSFPTYFTNASTVLNFRIGFNASFAMLDAVHGGAKYKTPPVIPVILDQPFYCGNPNATQIKFNLNNTGTYSNSSLLCSGYNSTTSAMARVWMFLSGITYKIVDECNSTVSNQSAATTASCTLVNATGTVPPDPYSHNWSYSYLNFNNVSTAILDCGDGEVISFAPVPNNTLPGCEYDASDIAALTLIGTNATNASVQASCSGTILINNVPIGCGDGILVPPEKCEYDPFTHVVVEDTCSAPDVCCPWGNLFCISCQCQPTIPFGCGNGAVDSPTEECDDGNSINTDACTNTCKDAKCGDSFVWAGNEECETNAQCTDPLKPTCSNCVCVAGTGTTGIGLSLDCPTVVGGTQADVIIKVWNIGTGDAYCRDWNAFSTSTITLGENTDGGSNNEQPTFDIGNFKTCASPSEEYPAESGRHMITVVEGAIPDDANKNKEHKHTVWITFSIGSGPDETGTKSCDIIFSPQPQKAPDVNMLLVVLVGIAGALAIRFKKK